MVGSARLLIEYLNTWIPSENIFIQPEKNAEILDNRYTDVVSL